MARPDRLVLAESAAAAEFGVSVDSCSASACLAGVAAADDDGVETDAAGVLATCKGAWEKHSETILLCKHVSVKKIAIWNVVRSTELRIKDSSQAVFHML